MSNRIYTPYIAYHCIKSRQFFKVNFHSFAYLIMYKRKKRETGSISSTKLTVESKQSTKTTKSGKEKQSKFSLVFKRTSQSKTSRPPSKKALPKTQGNWFQFWLNVLFNALFTLLQFFLTR